MSFFTKEYFSFFRELEKNNNKIWFDKNRSRYEEHVKAPFKKFTQHIIGELVKTDNTIFTEASKCIFRINKDIRFSKDKSPYKLNMAAVFGRGGTKDQRPGFYAHIGHKEIFIGGGMYMPEKADLEKIRQEIFYCNDEFKKIVGSNKFKDCYNEVLGEKNKALQPDYKEFSKEQPLIANKQFYYMAELSEKDVLQKDFDKTLLSYFKVGKPLNDFLYRAILSE